MDLKRGIDKAVEAIVEDLAKQTKKVGDSSEKIKQVAAISSNNDETIGDLIAQAFGKVGKEGVITVEEAKGTDTYVDVVEGMQFDRGYLSPYFVTDHEQMVATFENPRILLVDKKISSIAEILPMLEQVVEAQVPLLIVAHDVEGEALSTLLVNKLRGTLHCVAVKAPGFGDRRSEMLKDIAALTGAEVVSEDTGQKLENLGLSILGAARKVHVTKDDTKIVDGKGLESEVKARISQIKQALDNTESDYEREKLQERQAKLAGGVAVIRVGAPTETELKEKKFRLEDALSATRAAVEEGIVPGGGTAFINLLPVLEKLKLKGDEALGLKVVYTAIQVPLRVIADNSGLEGAVIVENVKTLAPGFGFDANIGDYVCMVTEGIVDPAKVVRVALQNAASIASMVLTSEAIIS